MTRLARTIGMSEDVLYNMVNARTSFTADVIEKIREQLKKPRSWPFTESGQLPPEGRRVSLAGTPLVPVKVVGYASAGPGTSNVDEISELVFVPAVLADMGGLGWIVDGESMLPALMPGDVALFREWRQPRVRVPFLILTRDGDYRVKRLVWHDARWHYESINPDFPIEPMKDGDQLQGYLIGWYRTRGLRETLDSDPDGLTLQDF